MSNIEHYFENLLFYGKDTTGDLNKKELTQEQIDTIQECVDYVLYSLFDNRDAFLDFAQK